VTTPYQRRRDPSPLSQGWEIAVAAIGVALLGLALAALVGLAIASAVWGRGWVWPHGTDTIGHVLGGLLTGRPGRGLLPAQARRVASPIPVYICVAVCELALVALSITAGALVARYRRPGDARGGMASRRDAEQALGRSRLRAAKEIIRPDLYGHRNLTASTARDEP
jgi:hypothetical protein